MQLALPESLCRHSQPAACIRCVSGHKCRGRAGAVQPQPIQLRQSLLVSAGNLVGSEGRDLGPQLLFNPAGTLPAHAHLPACSLASQHVSLPTGSIISVQHQRLNIRVSSSNVHFWPKYSTHTFECATCSAVVLTLLLSCLVSKASGFSDLSQEAVWKQLDTNGANVNAWSWLSTFAANGTSCVCTPCRSRSCCSIDDKLLCSCKSTSCCHSGSSFHCKSNVLTCRSTAACKQLIRHVLTCRR